MEKRDGQKKRDLASSIQVPVEIFSIELSPAEAVVKYLKDYEKLTYSQIGKVLNRDQRGIWGAYRRALQKQVSSFQVSPSQLLIPVKIFQDRTYPILEKLVLYLKEKQNIPVAQIAEMLDKSKSTIWTVYNRARRKSNEE
ncbi:hypothetical protein KY346_06575 [Candidatus Woesearchaeota archaeon]|nr:hypothetical protein [Candidatus Woesearchaeota archaeon]